MLFLIKFFGRTLAALPEIFSQAICVILGDLLFLLLGKRRQQLYSNLNHAFPKRNALWMRRTARRVWRRTIEMGLYVLVSPFMTGTRQDKTLILTESASDLLSEYAKNGKPVILLATHNCLVETLTLIRRSAPIPFPEIGVFYRPLNQKKVDDFVRESRGLEGMVMLSRKEGLHQALSFLRSGKWIGMLFDQNAGSSGRLGFFMNRVAATTDLPEVLSHKFKTDVVALYAERTSFWEANLHAELIAKGDEKAPVMLLANQWLENRLRKDQNFCSSWLWLHNRWKFNNCRHEQFTLEYKRSQIEEVREFYGWTLLPKTFRTWVSLPDSLGKIIRMIPLMEALRRGRPDAHITALCHPRFKPLLQCLNCFDDIEATQETTTARWLAGRRWQQHYMDVFLVMNESWQSDFDARNSKCLLRFGWEWPGSRRSMLSHTYKVDSNWDEEKYPEHELWNQCLRYFGLTEAPDFHPLKLSQEHSVINPLRCLQTESSDAPFIGLLCGAGSHADHCWTVDYWVELVAGLMDLYPQSNLCLFGTQDDQETARKITEQFEVGAVHDYTGSTDLLQFAEALSSCRLVVGNDCGGLHLANALGVPVVGLFGPTNPIRFGPAFNSPKRIIQPEHCPKTGGLPVKLINLSQVVEAIVELVEQPRSNEPSNFLLS